MIDASGRLARQLTKRGSGCTNTVVRMLARLFRVMHLSQCDCGWALMEIGKVETERGRG